jgi:hypothetical protein
VPEEDDKHKARDAQSQFAQVTLVQLAGSAVALRPASVRSTAVGSLLMAARRALGCGKDQDVAL